MALDKINDSITIDVVDDNITRIIPMDDVVLEIVWSDEHHKLIGIARVL